MNKPKKTCDTAPASNLGNKRQALGGRKSDAIRILIADDHTVVRDGLAAIIKQEGPRCRRRSWGRSPGG